jgi:hypothetical protein
VSLLLAWVPYSLWLLIAPLVMWPQATGGEIDSAWLVTALLAFAVGIGLKSVLGAVFAGMFGLYLMLYLLN